MPRTLVLLSVFVLPCLALGESRPPLEAVVQRDVLIVKCRTELKDDVVHYRVLETWKGKYSPDIFYHKPKDGYLHRGVDAKMFSSVKDGSEVIFFYSDNAVSRDRLNLGKIDAYRADDGLTVVDGKVKWGTNELDETVYTLAEFKKAVLETVAKQQKDKK